MKTKPSIHIGLSNAPSGPQIPSAFSFPTRCDIFVDRYGTMRATKDNEIVTLDEFKSNVMVYVYFMGICLGNPQYIEQILTIQQLNTLSFIRTYLESSEIITSDHLKNVSIPG